jgi:hypothetical protein
MANSILDSQYASPNALLTSHGFPVNTSGNTVLLSHSPAGTYPDPGGGSPDTTPDAFSFGTNPTGLALSAGTQTSDAATITDITAAAAFTFTGTDGSCEWRKNAGTWVTTGSGSCVDGDTLQLRHTAGTGYSQTVSGTITFTSGSVSATFSSTTIADPAGINLTHGSEFTITTAGTGLSFGTRAAKPLVYDNFESGTAGNQVDGQGPTLTSKDSGAWTWGVVSDGHEYPRYAATNLRANSTRNCLLKFGSSSGDSYKCTLEVDHARPNTGDEIYLTFWWRKVDTSFANSGTQAHSRNTKPFDLFDVDYLVPFAYVGMGNPDGDGGLRWNYSGGDSMSGWSDPTTVEELDSEWVRWEVWLKQSAPNTANGAMHCGLHRSGTPSINSSILAPRNTATTRTDSDYWQNLWIGSYCATEEFVGGPSNLAWSDIQLSSVYVDTTRQRLELGDNPVYASCTRREVQPSTAWSDTSITALCQKGAIPTGTAYLFVVGADGTASDGIEVEVA